MHSQYEYEDIDFRIRMKLSKCERYKTFQEDPPNRKYPASEKNNYQSIHRLKILSDDDGHLTKSSQTLDQAPIIGEVKEIVAEDLFSATEKIESEDLSSENLSSAIEKIESEKEEVTDEEILTDEKLHENPEINKDHTVVFRDYKRRIDLMLVVEGFVSKNTLFDRYKLDFLTNILRIGLQIEIETGQMKIHENLAFIKIHAPDSVLKEYGNMFAVQRHFVNNRLASNIYFIDHETEWLKIMRENYTIPDWYSNYERSLIVYKILRHLPFGDHVNQYGLHRLLKRNIILDAYALHDGPYFYVSDKITTGALGRQILHNNWAGLQNLFQRQPLHVIHEYFGPKIAFYYAFYGFYNAALMLASVAGIVSVLMPYFDTKEPNAMKQIICKESKMMCPECFSSRCHRRPLKDYCTSIALNVHLDHPHVLCFSMFMIFWVFAFITIWRRKEYILNWMWEVGGRDSYYETSKRPEFKVDYNNPRRSVRTGFKYDESGFYRVIRISMSIILKPLCLVAALAIMDKSGTIYDNFADLFITKEKPSKMNDYLVLAIFETLYTLLISVIEVVLHLLCYYIVELENHKFYKAYEKALIIKQFGCSITLMYPFMCFFAWLVGNLNLFYGRCQHKESSPQLRLFNTLHKWVKTPWHFIKPGPNFRPDCRRYCWPFTCINEVSVLLIVMLFMKQVIFRIVFNTYRLTTDYNETRKINANISCWEREYKLNEFNEAQLTRKYMILALQFSLITMFVIAFPLAPLVVLIVNVWDIRHSARKLLLASRRPILIRSPGIGAWNNILLFAAYVAIASNALTLVLTTRQNLREYFEKPLNSTVLNFLLFNHKFERPPLFINFACHAPFLLSSVNINSKNRFRWWGLIGERVTSNEFYIINLISCKLFLVFGLGVLCLAYVIKYIMKPYLRNIEESKNVENKIKNLYSHYAGRK